MQADEVIGMVPRSSGSVTLRDLTLTEGEVTGVNKGGYALYLRDPDGISVELFQPPATP